MRYLRSALTFATSTLLGAAIGAAVFSGSGIDGLSPTFAAVLAVAQAKYLAVVTAVGAAIAWPYFLLRAQSRDNSWARFLSGTIYGLSSPAWSSLSQSSTLLLVAILAIAALAVLVATDLAVSRTVPIRRDDA